MYHSLTHEARVALNEIEQRVPVLCPMVLASIIPAPQLIGRLSNSLRHFVRISE
jgi:hypothetical protein